MGEVRLDILVGAKDQGASATLQNVTQTLDSVALKAGVAGGAITAMLMKTALSGAQLGDEIAKASKRTGIAVEELSKLRYAAGQEDVAFSELTTSLRFLARGMYEAQGGSKEYADAFDALGIKLEDAKGELRPVEDVLLDISDAMRDTPNQAERTALAMQLFGRSGAQMLPFIQNGSEAISELTTRAQELGLEMSGESAQAAEEFGDRWSEVKDMLAMTTLAFTEDLLPVIRDEVLPTIRDATEWFKGMSDAHPGLITNVGKLGLALMAVGATAKFLSTVVVATETLTRVLGLNTAAASANAAAHSAAWAARLGPIGAVVGGIGVGLGIGQNIGLRKGEQALQSGLQEKGYSKEEAQALSERYTESLDRPWYQQFTHPGPTDEEKEKFRQLREEMPPGFLSEQSAGTGQSGAGSTSEVTIKLAPGLVAEEIRSDTMAQQEIMRILVESAQYGAGTS